MTIPKPERVRVNVEVGADDELADLAAQWDDAKRQADQAAARVKDLRAEIQAKLYKRAENESVTNVRLSGDVACPLELRYVFRTDFDSKRWREDNPGDTTYDKDGSRWELRRA